MAHPRLRWIITTKLIVPAIALAGGALWQLSMAQQRPVQALTARQDLQAKYGSTLTGLNGEPLLPVEGENCAVNDFDLVEQGFRMAGGVGGVGLADAVRARGQAIATAKAQAALDDGIESELGNNDAYDVAILVVDDFGAAPQPRLGDGVFGIGPGDDLASSVRPLAASGQLSHGALVFAHTLALVAHMPGARYEPSQPSGQAGSLLTTAVFLYEDGLGHPHRIAVQAIDTQHYATGVIAKAIQQALRYDADRLGIQRAVVNMSFAIVPCAVWDDYRASRYHVFGPGPDAGFEAYLDAIERETYGLLRRDLQAMLLTPLRNDPLERFLHDDKRVQARDVLAVASSGNDGLEFPYAPAAWDPVVAVGALRALTDDPVARPKSNIGGVRAGGAWYLVEDPLSVGGGAPRFTTVLAVAGTSFAAPDVAVVAARAQMLAGPACAFREALVEHSRRLDDLPLDLVVRDCLTGAN